MKARSWGRAFVVLEGRWARMPLDAFVAAKESEPRARTSKRPPATTSLVRQTIPSVRTMPPSRKYGGIVVFGRQSAGAIAKLSGWQQNALGGPPRVAGPVHAGVSHEAKQAARTPRHHLLDLTAAQRLPPAQDTLDATSKRVRLAICSTTTATASSPSPAGSPAASARRSRKAARQRREGTRPPDTIFGKDDVYVEMQNTHLDVHQRINPQLTELAAKLGLPTIATGDVHYLRHEDALAHEALLFIQSGDSLNVLASTATLTLPNGTTTSLLQGELGQLLLGKGHRAVVERDQIPRHLATPFLGRLFRPLTPASDTRAVETDRELIDRGQIQPHFFRRQSRSITGSDEPGSA